MPFVIRIYPLGDDVRGALESCGLDPAVGFLHRDRPGRPSLALDMMEEFRAYLADRLVCTLINRGQVKAKGFQQRETGAVIMDDATRKNVIVAWQERKQEIVEHPFLAEKMPGGWPCTVRRGFWRGMFAVTWTALRAKLVECMNPEKDSLRFYFLGANWKNRIEHMGAKPAYDPEGPLVL